MKTPTRQGWRAFYEKVAPLLVVFCIFCSMSASVGVYIGSRTNRAQDIAAREAQKDRTADNTALLACVDRFNNALAGALPPVREAGAARDEALMNALIGTHGIGGLLVRAQKGEKGDPAKTLADLLNTFDKLSVANANLIIVRANNPYPDPPSKFCELPN